MKLLDTNALYIDAQKRDEPNAISIITLREERQAVARRKLEVKVQMMRLFKHTAEYRPSAQEEGYTFAYADLLYSSNGCS